MSVLNSPGDGVQSGAANAGSHAAALRTFARNLTLLLMVRAALQWSALWFFFWGVVVLATRISGVGFANWFYLGLLGCLPCSALAAWRQWQRRPAFASVRAAYDERNRCGGVIMAAEVADTSAWQTELSPARAPRLRWRNGRTLGVLALAVLFVSVALLLPERLTALNAKRPLEIGQLVQELQAEIQVLEEEKILEDKKADDLQQQLKKIQEDASGVDPNKTWEALDHIKSANNDLARQAAEEALAKLTTLTQAETLAAALDAALDAGLNEDVATRAAQDLAALLKDAKLEEGLLETDIPEELLAELDGLNQADLEKLLRAIQANKGGLGKSIGKLAKLKLIDAELLGKCENAGKSLNPDALAAYLCENGGDCDSFAELAMFYCRGGVTRGRGDAPMTWTEGSSEEDAKFKEEVLPASERLSDSQFVGVSRSAPQLSGDDVVAGHGALSGAQGAGGSAHTQVILPRHKQTVKRFFERKE